MFSEMCVRSHFCTKSSVYECGVVLRCVLVYLLARLDSFEYVLRAPVCFGLYTCWHV